MSYVKVMLIDGDDDIWWEMPPDAVDRLASARDTQSLAMAAARIRDAINRVDEAIGSQDGTTTE